MADGTRMKSFEESLRKNDNQVAKAMNSISEIHHRLEAQRAQFEELMNAQKVQMERLEHLEKSHQETANNQQLTAIEMKSMSSMLSNIYRELSRMREGGVRCDEARPNSSAEAENLNPNLPNHDRRRPPDPQEERIAAERSPMLQFQCHSERNFSFTSGIRDFCQAECVRFGDRSSSGNSEAGQRNKVGELEDSNGEQMKYSQESDDEVFSLEKIGNQLKTIDAHHLFDEGPIGEIWLNQYPRANHDLGNKEWDRNTLGKPPEEDNWNPRDRSLPTKAACKVFDEMSNKRNEEPVPCTEILEPNLERSTSDSLIVGGDPSLKSEAEVNPESDFSYLGIGRAMIDDMTHKVVLKGNSPFSLLEFRLMDGSCLPEDTSSDDAHTVMSELMANSFHTIGIRMNNFRKISVSPFENYSAYQLFDKMPMRRASLFVGNWVVHQHVFDPGISKGCRGKQALGPSENFISCDNWFQELLLPQMCSQESVKVGSCTLLVGYQILVFDPGGVFCHDWVHYNSTYAAALVCICWVLGGLIFVWDPGGVVQPCLQVLRLS